MKKPFYLILLLLSGCSSSVQITSDVIKKAEKICNYEGNNGLFAIEAELTRDLFRSHFEYKTTCNNGQTFINWADRCDL